jgi:hypothetical protein
MQATDRVKRTSLLPFGIGYEEKKSYIERAPIIVFKNVFTCVNYSRNNQNYSSKGY